MSNEMQKMTLVSAEVGTEVVIKGIDTDDEELNSFLFTLGCYIGESIVVVSHVGSSFVVAIKDGRYSIDENLAEAILI